MLTYFELGDSYKAIAFFIGKGGHMTYPKLRLAMFWAEETQDDIAQLLGIDKGNLSKRFNHILNFKPHEKKKLARHYKTTIKNLFEED